MKKNNLCILALVAAIAATGCLGQRGAVTPEQAQCRKDVVMNVLGDVGGTVLSDVLSGKLDLTTALQQLGKSYNDVFAAVIAYRECVPSATDNPKLPRPQDFQKK